MTGSPGIEHIIRKGRRAVEKGTAHRLEALKVEYMSIDSVKPNGYNPNRQSDRDFDLLLRSMREDGFTQPIIAQRATRMIVDGEHRWRAARELGLPEIPVVLVDMTDEQMRVATLRHNRARGSEDVELGADVLRDLRELGALDWAQDSLAIDDAELDRLLVDADAATQLASADFGEAWSPTRVGMAGSEASFMAGRASYSDAADAKNTRDRATLEAAPDDAARIPIEHLIRTGNFRVVLTFEKEDAALVRSVLEPKPAQRLLEMCRAVLAKGEVQP